jgi:hypothetical protein
MAESPPGEEHVESMFHKGSYWGKWKRHPSYNGQFNNFHYERNVLYSSFWYRPLDNRLWAYKVLGLYVMPFILSFAIYIILAYCIKLASFWFLSFYLTSGAKTKNIWSFRGCFKTKKKDRRKSKTHPLIWTN